MGGIRKGVRKLDTQVITGRGLHHGTKLNDTPQRTETDEGNTAASASNFWENNLRALNLAKAWTKSDEDNGSVILGLKPDGSVKKEQRVDPVILTLIEDPIQPSCLRKPSENPYTKITTQDRDSYAMCKCCWECRQQHEIALLCPHCDVFPEDDVVFVFDVTCPPNPILRGSDRKPKRAVTPLCFEEMSSRLGFDRYESPCRTAYQQKVPTKKENGEPVGGVWYSSTSVNSRSRLKRVRSGEAVEKRSLSRIAPKA